MTTSLNTAHFRDAEKDDVASSLPRLQMYPWVVGEVRCLADSLGWNKDTALELFDMCGGNIRLILKAMSKGKGWLIQYQRAALIIGPGQITIKQPVLKLKGLAGKRRIGIGERFSQLFG